MHRDNQYYIGQLDHLADELAGCGEWGQRRLVGLLRKLRGLLSKYIDEEFDHAKAPIWDAKMETALIDLAVRSENGRVRAEAVDMLGDFSDSDQAASVVVDALSDQDRHVRACAARQAEYAAMRKRHLDDEVPRILLHLLSDPDKEVRLDASFSLGYIARRHAKVRRLIINFLRGPIPDRRDSLWCAMMAADDAYYDNPDSARSRSGLKEYADALLSVLMRLKDNSGWACWKAGESLGSHVEGEIGFGTLIQALRSPYACGRWSAVGGLMDLRNREAVPYLEEIAQHDRSKKVRERAREAIGLFCLDDSVAGVDSEGSV